jgi:hypothetical protein
VDPGEVQAIIVKEFSSSPADHDGHFIKTQRAFYLNRLIVLKKHS